MSPYARGHINRADWRFLLSEEPFAYWPRIPAPVASREPGCSTTLAPAQVSFAPFHSTED